MKKINRVMGFLFVLSLVAFASCEKNETVTKKASALDKFNNISNKRGYLYGMVTKKSLMFLRERQRHSEIEKAIAPGVTHEDSNLLFDIDSLLSDLTDLQRQIVMLHDIEGFSCFEIAIKIARTPIAVKKQLALAHQKLKRTYKNEC